jgi:SNF2 family DNA or RNA helicase
MAGMVIKELHARGRANRVLIVTPAPLSRQWIRELREMFELEFTRYDAPLLNTLWSNMGTGGNPWFRNNWI